MNWKMDQIKGVMILGILISASLLTAFTISSLTRGTYTYELRNFSSYEELIGFLNRGYENYTSYGYYYRDSPSIMLPKSSAAEAVDGSNEIGSSVDFSQTNIQVEGVDEPDIVKTDGTYLYIVSDSKIFIIKAYPAEDAMVLSEISLDGEMSLCDIFIHDDRLIVFGTSYRYPEVYDEYENYRWVGVTSTIIKIYDVSDREQPDLDKDIEADGGYFDARMMGDYVYVIATEYTYEILQVRSGNKTLNIPEITIDDETTEVPADHIYYVDIPERADTMTHVFSINLDNGEVVQKSFMLGSSQTMYVSQDNIYLTYTHYDYDTPMLENSYYTMLEKTVIHKISIDNRDISYVAQGEVPGRVLNQFSMDEYNRYFRIATTIGHVSRSGGGSTNNVYILDGDLTIVGEVENLAPGERIYSVRFMGNRGYLVTFKKVDPLFVVDLQDPENPLVLGKLKIPGYSDYLHPYDEHHIIGIGKDTVEAEEGDFAWYQGIKMAIFDVSDVENPEELHRVVIGDRGTDSPALHDHKAFLFDKERNLLVIPILLAEIQGERTRDNQHGEYVFQGAYVFNIDLVNGFDLKGRITHQNNDELMYSGYYFYSSYSVKRSVYIGNTLYTISDEMVKMNDLETLSEINSVELG